MHDYERDDRRIRIAAHDGGEFEGYLAVPASGSGPGLVLCQEIFGLNGFVRQTAERLAEEGYVVLAPDLFWRQQPGIELTDGPDDMPRAFALYQGFDEDLGVRDIGSAVAALRALPEFKGGVGALGYCLGGKLAYLAACRCDVDVAVGYYGVGIENSLEEASRLRGRLVLHIAERDGFCPPEARERILAALGGKPGVELYVYPGLTTPSPAPAARTTTSPPR